MDLTGFNDRDFIEKKFPIWSGLEQTQKTKIKKFLCRHKIKKVFNDFCIAKGPLSALAMKATKIK